MSAAAAASQDCQNQRRGGGGGVECLSLGWTSLDLNSTAHQPESQGQSNSLPTIIGHGLDFSNKLKKFWQSKFFQYSTKMLKCL